MIENSAEGGMTIITPDNQSARIRFTSPSTNNDVGGATIFYRQNINKMLVGTAVAGGVLSLASGAGVEAMHISADGEVTKPLQPAFSATVNAAQNNIATDTDVVVVWGAETFDVGANFSASEFTAPVTGKYQLNLLLRLNNIDTACNYYIISFFSSNNNYRFIYDPGGFSGDLSYWATSLSVLADMDANDTVYITINQAGGTAPTDVDPGNTYSRFSGYLVA